MRTSCLHHQFRFKVCCVLSTLFAYVVYCTFRLSLDHLKTNLDKRGRMLDERDKLLRNTIVELLDWLIILKLSVNKESSLLIDEKYNELQKYLLKLKTSGETLTSHSFESDRDNYSLQTYGDNHSLRSYGDNHSLQSYGDKIPENNSVFSHLSYSCNEYFNGTTFGYPFYTKGFVRPSCGVPSLNETLSVILDRPRTSKDELKIFAEKFKYTYIITNDRDDFGTFDNVEVIRCRTNCSVGGLLNTIVKKLKTPLVLIAPYMVSFVQPLGVERLVNVLESTNASVVGCATKDIDTGEWYRGCYQFHLKFYTLTVKDGYYFSERECLYCNYTRSPFVAKTSLLHRKPFRENLTFGVYKDFFLNLKDHKVLVCPDVMFHTFQPKEMAYQLRDFVNNWDIKKIVYPSLETLWFGCRKGFNHTSKRKCVLEKGMAVPPCCLANLADAIKLIFKLCNQLNISCQLLEGSVLGAIKFNVNHVLPWERDADFGVASNDLMKFKLVAKEFKIAGHQLVVDEEPTCCTNSGDLKGGVMHIRASGWSIQIYGHNKLYVHDGTSLKTSLRLHDTLIYLPENPGQYIRNRYGNEIYKHSEHWFVHGAKNGWESYDTSTGFVECAKPGHHACLDQHLNDGDIPFQD